MPIPVPLHRIAHGRSGDKGNTLNLSVIAYRAEWFDLILEQVTEARVAAVFADRRPTRVTRYVLPNLAACNFVLENVLDGGVNESMNLDAHGKCTAFHLLDIEVSLHEALASLLDGAA